MKNQYQSKSAVVRRKVSFVKEQTNKKNEQRTTKSSEFLH